MGDIFFRLESTLEHYWKLCNKDGDDCFLMAFMFDGRYINENLMKVSADTKKYKKRLKIMYKRDYPNKTRDAIAADMALLYEITRKFRKKQGIFKDVWKGFGSLGPWSTWEDNLRLLNEAMEDNQDNLLAVWWLTKAIIYGSMLATQGRLESSFNPIKGFHNPKRACLGVEKLRRLVYCNNQSANVKRFDSKWKQQPKIKPNQRPIPL